RVLTAGDLRFMAVVGRDLMSGTLQGCVEMGARRLCRCTDLCVSGRCGSTGTLRATRNGGRGTSPPADRAGGHGLLAREVNFFRFMADDEALAFRELVFHFFHANFNLESLPTICEGKAKDGVFLWGAVRPKRQRPVVVPHAAEPVNEHHPRTSHGG